MLRVRRPRARTAPVITLLTDFGTTDTYVAEMKAVLLNQSPGAAIVDATHDIEPQDVQAAAVTLERLLRVFAQGTVHIAVVDPGVGTDRRLLLVEIKGQYVLCPDNGLITWAWRRHPQRARAHELIWPPTWESCTFHGRDILAPAAAMLASGQMHLGELCKPIDDPVLLDLAPATAPVVRGQIIHFDHFGNAITNVPVEEMPIPRPRAIRLHGRKIPFHQTYAKVNAGKAVALVGSSGLVEIAVRNGCARKSLKLKLRDTLTLS